MAAVNDMITWLEKMSITLEVLEVGKCNFSFVV